MERKYILSENQIGCLNDRFEVPKVDVLLTDELTGDLRTMPVDVWLAL